LFGGFLIFAVTPDPQLNSSVVEYSDEAVFDDVVVKLDEIFSLLRRDYYQQDKLDLSAMKE
jgi:hypothetical protein